MKVVQQDGSLLTRVYAAQPVSPWLLRVQMADKIKGSPRHVLTADFDSFTIN